ncbi:hypothetical protein [uncultured Jatrophihabitans sp.]|uniref:hypothetical protein n=1 Tax=uncultured Jatrophihabitans sp. TaxID=1610747 RepID=UPI0035CB1104
MPDIEDAPDMFQPMPDVDPNDASGEQAAAAADQHHSEVDGIAEDADPDGLGHGATE